MDIDLRDLLGSQQGLTVNRRPFSLACLGKGSTTFPSKLESLLWQIMLETAYDEDPEACVLKYAKQVISITTDQGVESLVGQAPTLSIEQFLKDVAADLKAKPKIDKQSALEDEMSLDLRARPPMPSVGPEEAAPALAQAKQGCPPAPTGAVSDSASASAGGVEVALENSHDLAAKLFENCIVVHGIKHIVDNLLKATLETMNLFLDLLQLQFVETSAVASNG